MSEKLKAVLFDCDGVLAETERDGHRVAFNKTFDEFQIAAQWDVAFYSDLVKIGGGKNRMRHFFCELEPDISGFADSDISAEELLTQLHRRKTEIFTEIVAAGALPPRLGVARLIEQALANGLKVGIASTSAVPSVQGVLRTVVDEQTYQQVPVFAGDMVTKSKPDPAIYQLAMNQLGVSPEECVIIEDSEIGCLAGVRSGAQVLVTTSFYTGDDDFSGAMAVLDSLGSSAQPAQLISGNPAVLADGLVSYESLERCWRQA